MQMAFGDIMAWLLQKIMDYDDGFENQSSGFSSKDFSSAVLVAGAKTPPGASPGAPGAFPGAFLGRFCTFCSRLPCGDRYLKRKVTFYSKLRFEKKC